MIRLNTWYVNRLRSMSVPEVVYRLGKTFDERIVSINAERKSHACDIVSSILPKNDLSEFRTPLLNVFGYKINPCEIRDWSYDISSNRSFPKIKSKKIDVRTNAGGNVKYIWEVNRMLFLPCLAIEYRNGNVDALMSICKIIKSWVDQNPYKIGINWYSNIEINIRLINWFITWEILDADNLAKHDKEFEDFINETWIPSIYEHCHFSFDNPSMFSSANNHLIAEYAGLFIASSKWKFDKSEIWNVSAKEGLEQEIIKQHSENGINKEEASEYIQFITDFLLLSLIVGDNTQNSFSSSYKQRVKKIFQYISSFLDIKGNSPKYGDEDNGRMIRLNKENDDNNFVSLLLSGALYYNDDSLLCGLNYPDQKNILLFGKEKVFDYFKTTSKIEKLSSFFPKEGHIIFRKRQKNDGEIFCHFNAAPLGYLSIAAHGHADALSFVLHIDGQPFFIDPGAFCYQKDSEWRGYFVSTLAHNTITINDANQAIFVGPTLWHQHYDAKVKGFYESDLYEYAIAEHNGYERLKVSHTRKIEFFKNEHKFIITDTIRNSNGIEIKIDFPFHIHPEVICKRMDNQYMLSNDDRKVTLFPDQKLDWKLVNGQMSPKLGWYSPSFFQKTSCPVLIGSIKTSDDINFKTEINIGI